MKRIILSISIIITSIVTYTQENSELFFSEYVEGTGNNKAIEIYNPTNNIINLNKYWVVRYSNGSTTFTAGGSTQLQGFIQPHSVFVLVNGQTEDIDYGGGNISPKCDPALQELADQLDHDYPAPTYMDGNDAIGLVKSETGNVEDAVGVDLFGKIGGLMTSSDEGWTDFTDEYVYKNTMVIDGIDTTYVLDSSYIENYIVPEGYDWISWTSNHTLTRKMSVTRGITQNPEVFRVSMEWDSLAVNTFDHLGWFEEPLYCDTVEININYDIKLPTCNNYNDGAIYLNITGDNPDFSFLWLNNYSLTTKDLENINSGIYTIKITDNTGCIQNDTIIVDNPSPIISSTILTNELCYGDSIGKIKLNVTGGIPPYSYHWSEYDNHTDSLVNLLSGCYSVTIIDSLGCEKELNYCISEPNSISVQLKKTDNVCFGDSTGKIESTVTGGTSQYTYFWSNNETIDLIVNLKAGIYELQVTDFNGCKESSEIELIDPPKVQISEIIGEQNVEPNKTYLYSVDYTTNSTYQWFLENGNIISGQETNSINVQWGSYEKGTISAVKLNEDGCVSDTAKLEVNIGSSDVKDIVNNENIKIYPNPANENLVVLCNENFVMEIYDLFGRKLIVSEKKETDISDLLGGMYIVLIKNRKGIIKKLEKLVIEY